MPWIGINMIPTKPETLESAKYSAKEARQWRRTAHARKKWQEGAKHMRAQRFDLHCVWPYAMAYSIWYTIGKITGIPSFDLYTYCKQWEIQFYFSLAEKLTIHDPHVRHSAYLRACTRRENFFVYRTYGRKCIAFIFIFISRKYLATTETFFENWKCYSMQSR